LIRASLPGLIRQSMRRVGLLRAAILFDLLHVSMDHRVIGGAKRRRSSNGLVVTGKESRESGNAARNDERVLAGSTASGRRGRIAGRLVNRDARSACRISSRRRVKARAEAK
jgi:hypothetical protein